MDWHTKEMNGRTVYVRKAEPLPVEAIVRGYLAGSGLKDYRKTGTVRDISLRLYSFAADYARSRGIIIADTKFEFGLADGELILIDELLTPDSSRFWPVEGYAAGRPQPSFDKQYVRDYLEGLDWDKKPPAPELPDEVVNKTSEKYWEALQRLTK